MNCNLYQWNSHALFVALSFIKLVCCVYFGSRPLFFLMLSIKWVGIQCLLRGSDKCILDAYKLICWVGCMLYHILCFTSYSFACIDRPGETPLPLTVIESIVVSWLWFTDSWASTTTLVYPHVKTSSLHYRKPPARLHAYSTVHRYLKVSPL